ncbi:MAG: hypothetical protein ABI140_19960 [Jatrophihabitantaceae bacterium]
MYDILDVTGIRVVRSGRRHKIGVAHIVAVTNAVDPIPVGDQLLFVGVDDRGIELEIIAVPDNRNPETLAVIHAMPTEFRKGHGDGEKDED